ncbi:protein raptor like protein [Ditylenchus destructor]|nr:protein raptor like protein [Ditylenchus destructor]
MHGAEKVWFREARHVEEITCPTLEIDNKDDWRKIRERMKTVSVALVLCLNVGVDPPDIEKPVPSLKKQHKKLLAIFKRYMKICSREPDIRTVLIPPLIA